MKIVDSLLDEATVQTLKQGGVVVARTDTLYGVLARANDDHAVEKVYQLKKRSIDKSPIVLIATKAQIFDTPTPEMERLLGDAWPGPVTVIVPGKSAPVWLRRDNDSVAYRLPAHEELRRLIERVGPLIAPSANLEGQPPANDIQAARDYFGDAVDVYVDGGTVTDAMPSQLLRVDERGQVVRLR